jgi:hypothetical protein
VPKCPKKENGLTLYNKKAHTPHDTQPILKGIELAGRTRVANHEKALEFHVWGFAHLNAHGIDELSFNFDNHTLKVLGTI